MRIFHPLRCAPVALLWGGLSLSALGDQLYAVALTWIAVGVFGAEAGFLSALQALALLLAVLGIGRWADRWDRQRSMIGADLARAGVLAGGIALWTATGGPSAPLLIGIILVLAVGQAIFQPALQSVLATVVGDAQFLPAANGLLDATDRSARLLGPGLVALFAGLVPVMHFLTLDAISFLASAAALLLISRLRPARPPLLPTGRETIWRGITRGVRAMSGHKLLGYFLATAALLNGSWYAVFYLGLPLLIAQHRPGGSGLSEYGMVLSAYGCTNLLATIVFGSRTLPDRPQLQMFGGNFIVGLGLVLLGLASTLPGPWLLPGLMAAAAFGAIGGPMKDIPMAVLRQTRLHPGDIAAAMRVYIAAGTTGTLLAMLLMPVAIGRVGVLPAVSVCGAIYIGVGAIGLMLNGASKEASQQALLF